MSDDISIGKRNSFRGRTNDGAHETFTGGSSSLHDIRSPDEWLSGKAKSNVSVDAEGILVQAHDRLGQIPSTGDGSLKQHNTVHHRVCPHMMLTGHEKSLPLTLFYPENEGKKTSPEVYVRDVIRRQQELNDLCRRNNQQAQARQRKKFDKKAAGAKAYSVAD